MTYQDAPRTSYGVAQQDTGNPMVNPFRTPKPRAKAGRAMLNFWSKSFDFQSRTNAREYWFGMLSALLLCFVFFVGIWAVIIAGMFMGDYDQSATTRVVGVIVAVVGYGGGIFGLVIPTVALAVRRLRDSGNNLLWVLGLFTPLSMVFLVILGFLPSKSSISTNYPYASYGRK